MPQIPVCVYCGRSGVTTTTMGYTMRVLVLSLFIFATAIPLAARQSLQTAERQKDDIREKAVSQMRRIAGAMKSCPEEIKSTTDIATYYVGPPTNLEWNVSPSKTVRAPFQGDVTFTLPERAEESQKAKHSRKLHKKYMDAEIAKAAYAREGYYRYEFDLGNSQPELVKVSFIDERTGKPQLVPSGGEGTSCWERAASSTDEEGVSEK